MTDHSEAQNAAGEKIDQGRRKFFENTIPVALGISAAGAALASIAASANTASGSLDRQVIGGLPWQSNYGFTQGNVISGQHRVFHMAGQGPTNENGEIVHSNDMRGQVSVTLDNMKSALILARMTWKNVINLSVYTTDMHGFFEVFEETLYQRVTVEGGAKFGGALLQISGFAFPDMKIEIVGLAVSA